MKLKTYPLKHQSQCLQQFGHKQAFALTAEMGTGKTWIIMINLAGLYELGQCDAALVFAPNGVHTNWVRLELPKHMPEDIPYEAVAWNKKASVQKQLKRLILPSPSLRILTMNWEALSTKDGFAMAHAFCASSAKLAIICDESDEIKNPRTQRAKALMKLRDYARWRRIMTGTPMDGTPYPAFSQYNFLDPSILNCQNYVVFKSTYAVMLHAKHPKMLNIMKRNNLRRVPQIEERDANGRIIYRNLDKLAALLAPHTFRVLKKECVDLPDKIYKTITFEMTSSQWEKYKLAEDEYRLEYKGEETPVARLAVAGKLCQITSGYYLHPDSDEPVRIEGENPKMNLLKEWVRSIVDQGGQVIVWARYTVQIHDIAKAMDEEGIVHATYYGETDDEGRTMAIDGFQEGRIKVFIGNQQAGGTGITLTRGDYVIYFSNTFRLRDRLQSEDRAHRIGRTEKVVYLDFAAQDTIDEKIVQVLSDKQEISELIQSGAIKVVD